jgi:hypothetical protein
VQGVRDFEAVRKWAEERQMPETVRGIGFNRRKWEIEFMRRCLRMYHFSYN